MASYVGTAFALKTTTSKVLVRDRVSAKQPCSLNTDTRDRFWIIDAPAEPPSSPMAKVKKLLSSPASRRKQQAVRPPTPSYFALPLEEVAERDGYDVPLLLTRVVDYITQAGLDCEGIFRVNGNVRVIDKLKVCFEKTGDADLESEDDVMAAAGLLKLFLRELPDGVIPMPLTYKFITAQKECAHEPERCLVELRSLLQTLPAVSYRTLHRLIQFLVIVAQNEEKNKMGPVPLSIVFGPCLFRCSDDIQGLQDQGITNQIVRKFILEYDKLFTEPTKNRNHFQRTLAESGKQSPPRPPPPKWDSNQNPPNPPPRKHKMKLEAKDRIDEPDSGDKSNSSHTSGSVPSDVMTPRYSDDECLDTFRSASPFCLDSERSEYSTSQVTPPVSSINTEMVESAISSSVTEYLFGDPRASISSDEGTIKTEAPVPPPRKNAKPWLRTAEESPESSTAEEQSDDDDDDDADEPVSIQQRIRRLQAEKADPDNKTADNKSSAERTEPQSLMKMSKAYELFEKQGLIISMAPNPALKSNHGTDENVVVSVDSDDDDSNTDSEPKPHPVPVPRATKKRHLSPTRVPVTELEPEISRQNGAYHVSSAFDTIPMSLDSLPAFKRDRGPRNRRTPSRHSVKLMGPPSKTEPIHVHIDDRLEDSPPLVMVDEEEDENHNSTKPSIHFLSIHQNGATLDKSPDRSPINSRKPYIPPLDLTILHEHGDGNEPIPAEQGPSLAMQKAKSFKSEDNVVVSPRMGRLKKKKNRADNEAPLSPSAFRIIAHSSAHLDTSVPPSPPVDQVSPMGRRQDQHSSQIKQLTKKIQGCKKRLRLFEEEFEDEHGYKPCQTDKAARPEIRKHVQELAKARKELKKLKEAAEKEQYRLDVPQQTTVQQDLTLVDSPEPTPHMEDTLQSLLKQLLEKRKESGRPEDLALLSKDQIQDEKQAIQRTLLSFENLHGRPTTKQEKELMRPLYDRYRTVKRLVLKAGAGIEKRTELESVPEGHTMEFATPTTASTDTISDREPIRVPTADVELEKDEWMVTGDPKMIQRFIEEDNHFGDNLSDLSPPEKGSARNLHELTVPQLLEEQHQAKTEKKKFRKILRVFEDEFYQQNGRKVQKEDRAPMESAYTEYKQIKAKLKLLDALLSKYSPAGDM